MTDAGLKIVFCKDCGADETMPSTTPEPWVCPHCMELHKLAAARDQELENELNQEEC